MPARSRNGTTRRLARSIRASRSRRRYRRRPSLRRIGDQLQFHPLPQPGQPGWKSGPGEGKSVDWPVGVGGKGNEGVAGYVEQIPNSIGYVEYAYVLQNKMAPARLQNAAGNFVTAERASFQAAAASADWTNAQDFFLVMTNAPGANAYPITATTFVLMHRQPKDKARSDTALDFFRWALEDGQGQARKLDYVPLPAQLVGQIESYIGASIK